MENIEIRGVSKRYGGKAVLDGLTLTLLAGKTNVLMGPSGCGKTTLLRLLAGLETPDSGEIRGLNTRSLAMVFQEDRLISHLSARRNVQAVLSGPEAQAKAEEALAAMNLAGSMDKPARALSGGMARRVAIARALAFDAATIIMDEPFKGLDEETYGKVVAEVLRRTAGRTLIVVTHDPDEARLLGGHVIRMP